MYTLGEDRVQGLCLVCTLLVCEDEGVLYSTDAFLATEKGNAPSKRRTVCGRNNLGRSHRSVWLGQ